MRDGQKLNSQEEDSREKRVSYLFMTGSVHLLVFLSVMTCTGLLWSVKINSNKEY